MVMRGNVGSKQGLLSFFFFFKMKDVIECLYTKGDTLVKMERLVQEKEELIVETKSFSR